jgi:hypothetical protein
MLMKKRRSLLFLVVVVALALALPQIVFATPDAPRVVINPSTQECDPVFYWSDECGHAILPPGWEFSTVNACPASYKQTELTAEWTKAQNDFCCQARGGDYCPSVLTPLLTIIPASPTPVPQTIVPTPAPAPKTVFPIWLVAVGCAFCAAAVLVLGGLLFLVFRKKT